jgi:DNA-binding Xre family transcriptional regulator
MSRIKIELEKVLKERKISKNQLCYACKHTQLNNYCKNKVVRVDLATIAKICDYVGCSIADILVLEKDEEPGKEIAEE